MFIIFVYVFIDNACIWTSLIHDEDDMIYIAYKEKITKGFILHYTSKYSVIIAEFFVLQMVMTLIYTVKCCTAKIPNKQHYKFAIKTSRLTHVGV